MTSLLTQGPLFLVSLIFMLGIVVVIHELGHYWAGRWFNAAAESFSVGFGRPIFERVDRRGTRWRVNWIPLGGFVKFVGEQQLPRDVRGGRPDGPEGLAFSSLGVGARSIIALAGPVANFVLAALLFALIFLFNGSPRQAISIAEVQPESPAAMAGLQPGDEVVAIDGARVDNLQDFMTPIIVGSGKSLPITVRREGGERTLTVVPERRERENGVGQIKPMGTIGVGLNVTSREPQRYGPVSALAAGVNETGATVSLTVDMIGRMVTGKEPLSNLSGPVGIGDITRRVVNQTMGAEQVPLGARVAAMVWTIVQLCALVSVGIGLFNLLPLPVLDGGHLVFNAYEAVTGKALPEKIQEASLTAGLILLLGIAFIVTWGDIVDTGILRSGS